MIKKYISEAFPKPIIEIHNPNMDAHYYDDGSGEVALNYDNKEFFFKEDGGLKYQIKYIEEHLAELQKNYKEQTGVCKKAILLLKKAKLKAKL